MAGGSLGGEFEELRTLLTSYAKQETIEPLKGLGKYLKFGLPGAILMGTGLFLVCLSVLRALQTQTGDHLTGSLSWVPYFVTVIVLVVAIVVLVRLPGKKKRSIQ
jgi:ABC-type multidrug transport system permease subunit